MKTPRIKINFLMKDNNEIPSLIYSDDKLLLHTKQDNREILIKDIEKIKISIVNRLYTPSKDILKNTIKGVLVQLNTSVEPVYFNYYIDLDIYTKDYIYYFESTDLQESSKLIKTLTKKVATVEDSLNLMDLFETKTIAKMQDIFDKNYKQWAKKYHLDNPRTTKDEQMEQLINKKIK